MYDYSLDACTTSNLVIGHRDPELLIAMQYDTESSTTSDFIVLIRVSIFKREPNIIFPNM